MANLDLEHYKARLKAIENPHSHRGIDVCPTCVAIAKLNIEAPTMVQVLVEEVERLTGEAQVYRMAKEQINVDYAKLEADLKRKDEALKQIVELCTDDGMPADWYKVAKYSRQYAQHALKSSEVQE